MAAPITAAAAMRAGTMTQKEETDRQKSLQQQIAESDREDHVRYLEERARRAADVTASALASAASDGAGAPGGGDALEAAIQQHNAMAAEQLPGGDGAAGGKAGPGPGQPSEAPSSPNQSGPDGGPIVAETGGKLAASFLQKRARSADCDGDWAFWPGLPQQKRLLASLIYLSIYLFAYRCLH